MSEAGDSSTLARKRRRFHWSLRTMLVAVTLLGAVLGWLGYHLNWTRERQAIVSSSEFRAHEGSFFLEPPPVAPWPLRLFDDRAYRVIALVVVDPSRAQSDDEMYTRTDDPRLTPEERRRIARVAQLFPEARTSAWFRKTPPPLGPFP